MNQIHLYLASQSPRRIEYLQQLQVSFQAIQCNVDETLSAHLSAELAVEELAKRKANAGCEALCSNSPCSNALYSSNASGLPILAADTLVFLDETPLGKPKDLEAAQEMLRRLSGKTHRVITSLAIKVPETKVPETKVPETKVPETIEMKQVDARHHWHTRTSVTEVTFVELSEASIRTYCATGEPFDKAGAYGIQGLGQAFVSQIKGCYSSVVGLPLFQLVDLLDELSIPNVLSRASDQAGPNVLGGLNPARSLSNSLHTAPSKR